MEFGPLTKGGGRFGKAMLRRRLKLGRVGKEGISHTSTGVVTGLGNARVEVGAVFDLSNFVDPES